MKQNIVDFMAGFVFGCMSLILPSLLTNNKIGWGQDLIVRLFPAADKNISLLLLLIGIYHLIFGFIFFWPYLLISIRWRQWRLSTRLFSLPLFSFLSGVTIAYILILLILLFAISQWKPSF